MLKTLILDYRLKKFEYLDTYNYMCIYTVYIYNYKYLLLIKCQEH